MKYSFILPYYKRRCFQYTLETFFKMYTKQNHEIIVIEDNKNFIDINEHNFLLDLQNKYNFTLLHNTTTTFNPCISFNLGVKYSSGDFLILSNPECIHEANILNGLDIEFEKDIDVYVVCSCKSLDKVGNFIEWYQHSIYSPRNLHFCSAISRFNYDKICGFDEQYRYGVGYDDDDFLYKIRQANIKIVTRDDLVTSHLYHERSYQSTSLVDVNRKYFNRKWNQNR